MQRKPRDVPWENRLGSQRVDLKNRITWQSEQNQDRFSGNCGVRPAGFQQVRTREMPE